MLRTAATQTTKTGIAQRVRSFATPASSLSSNTPPGPFATDGPSPQASAERPRRDAITSNYWEAKKPIDNDADKAPKELGDKDAGDKGPVRKGVMQNLFF